MSESQPNQERESKVTIATGEVAGKTQQQMLAIALSSLDEITRERGGAGLDPSFAADQIVKRTGLDFETAALAAFSRD